ncbi:Hsp70 family protein [Skermania sp. ID1734]|uniref:Hsp70 family protein n=1 Tax=Skermania sp. ID1734 TaxID=2597516 RepID=UPI00163D6127|nr:Hsp70 family protein [Skermania sp. ID1734]
MAAGLGMVVGSSNSVAVIDFDGDVAPDGSEHRVVTRRSALALRDGASPRLLEQHDAAQPDDVVVEGFVARVGDPVGILADDGSTYTGEDLTATALACLAHEATRDVAEPPTVIAYPTTWPKHTIDALRGALDRTELGKAKTVPEAVAAAHWLNAARGPLDDGAVVVYDLGASSLDVSVVRTGGEPEVLGKPIRSEDIAGSDFDHSITQHVLSVAGAAGVNPFDPEVERALAEVRRRCVAAKEALSVDTDTTVLVELAGQAREIRLVRSEVEDLIRPALLTSIDLVQEAVRQAGLDVADIGQVVITGGGANIPLVAELLSARLRLPVVAGATPALTSALGAAAMAASTKPAIAKPVVAPAAAAALASRPPRAAAAAPAALPTPVAVEAGPPKWKRLAVIGSIAAAIMLVAAGGLAMGTGMMSDNTPASNSTPSSVAPGTTMVNGVPVSAAPGAGTNAPAAPNSPGGATANQATAPGTSGGGSPQSNSGGQSAAPVAGNGGGSAPAQDNSAPAAGGGAPAQSGGGTGGPSTYQSPAPLPSSGGGSPSNGSQLPGSGAVNDLGNGVGGAANGIGNGVGGAVSGLGNGVGKATSGAAGTVNNLLPGSN